MGAYPNIYADLSAGSGEGAQFLQVNRNKR